MNPITKEVDSTITRAAKRLVTKGGSFEHVRNEAVTKVHNKYPRLDTRTLLGGFNHRYAEALARLS